MAYRSGTYIAFHADGETNPTASDMKYYSLLKGWKVRDDDFNFVNSHEKTGAVRDSSKKDTLRRALISRMNNSKNLLLIIGSTTKNDTDWVPFEIKYAVETCSIPIIVVYTGYNKIMAPSELSHLWPAELAKAIKNETVGIIHVPFKKEPIADAISQFDMNNHPKTTLNYYSAEAYASWGL
ncbi:MAG: TIR domain-containing protein [Candidatus Pacebacteria bacterium]|nr:TIR domain-containing protein [Candidatus Paceibacterota bacterium]